MPRKCLYRHVDRFRTRHGKLKSFYRSPITGERIRLPDAFGSPEWLSAYLSAANGTPSPVTTIGAKRVGVGTVAAVVATYLQSPLHRTLGKATAQSYRSFLDKFREAHGGKALRTLKPTDIVHVLSGMSAPEQRNSLKPLRHLFRHGIAEGVITVDPSAGYQLPRHKATPARIWEAHEIAAWNARYGFDTPQRLASAIFIAGGPRGRSDLAKLGRQHLKDGNIVFKAQKNGESVTIPVTAEIAACLAHVPSGQMLFFPSERGTVMAPSTFSDWFMRARQQCGLPDDLTPHGLRHRFGVEMAHAGATPHEIMAALGDKSLAMALTYTQQANKETLGQQAHAKLRAAEA